MAEPATGSGGVVAKRRNRLVEGTFSKTILKEDGGTATGLFKCMVPENYVVQPDVLCGKFLGEGFQGAVLAVTNHKTQEQLVVKQINIKKIKESKHKKQATFECLLREWALLKIVCHAHIVQYSGAFYDNVGGFFYMELERMDQTLAHIIEEDNEPLVGNRKQRMRSDITIVGFFLYQILSAVDYLDRKAIMHRDIKPDNIGVNWEECNQQGELQRMSFKLLDLGFSRIRKRNPTLQTKDYGSPIYRAPELLFARAHDSKVDVWSVLTTAWDALTGNPLFLPPTMDYAQFRTQPRKQQLQQAKERQLVVCGTTASKYSDAGYNINFAVKKTSRKPMESWMTGEIKHEHGSCTGTNFYSLLDKVLVFDPANRPSAAQCLKYEFFNGINDTFLGLFHENMGLEPNFEGQFLREVAVLNSYDGSGLVHAFFSKTYKDDNQKPLPENFLPQQELDLLLDKLQFAGGLSQLSFDDEFFGEKSILAYTDASIPAKDFFSSKGKERSLETRTTIHAFKIPAIYVPETTTDELHGQFLGEGAFGPVLSCKNWKTKEYVVLKQINIRLERFPDEESDSALEERQQRLFRHILQEWALLKMICHPHICTYHGAFFDRSAQLFYIVTERFHMTVRELIESSNPTKSSTTGVCYFLAQTLRAVDYLDHNMMIHGNISPDNMAVKCRRDEATGLPRVYSYKLIDLGLSKICDPDSSRGVREYAGSPYYAPELIFGRHYDSKVDVWSVFATACELFTGKPMFLPAGEEFKNSDEPAHFAVIPRIQNRVLTICGIAEDILPYNQAGYNIEGSYPLTPRKPMKEWLCVLFRETHMNCNETNLLNLIDSVFVFDPKQRPSAEKCIQHQFFVGAEKIFKGDYKQSIDKPDFEARFMLEVEN